MSATENNTTANEQRQVGFPKPLEIGSGRHSSGLGDYTPILLPGEDDFVGVIYGDSPNQSHERAAFIVKAVNAHEGLVEALRSAWRDFENIRRNLNTDDNQTREDKCCASMGMIDAALEASK